MERVRIFRARFDVRSRRRLRDLGMSANGGVIRGVSLHLGDCLGVMRGLEADSVDSVVTDPPAGISFMGKEWDSFGGRCNRGAEADRGAADRGFGKGGAQPFGYSGSSITNPGQRGAFVAYLAERMGGCLRVAKPGAHALVWALPRTSHWTALALEDAGWIIEDRIAHLFGTGFPKHKSKLKPATEDWWLCTKPGGAKWLGVDACRVAGHNPSIDRRETSRRTGKAPGRPGEYGSTIVNRITPEAYMAEREAENLGRWPSNVVLTHHPDCNGKCVEGCPVAEMDRQSGASRSNPAKRNRNPRIDTTQYRNGGARYNDTAEYGDSGGASRYFPTFAWEADDFAPFLYCAKASRSERGEGNRHPTVKPLALMQWLVRLVTPAGGTVLDPFAGSGTTGLAALKEGFRFVGAENDPDSHAYAHGRLARAAGTPRQTTLFEA